MARKTKPFAPVNEEYNITLTGKNIEMTDAIRDYAIEKVSKIERFTHRIIDVTIVLEVQKLQHKVDIVLKSGNIKIKGSAASIDIYASIDKAVDRITEQLRRYKTRLQDHQARGLKVVDMNVNVLRPPAEEELLDVNEEIEEENKRRLEANFRPHEIVEKETRPLKILRVDEAIMKMELSGDAFMIYRSEEDQKIKVIYRRRDENYGIIEPE